MPSPRLLVVDDDVAFAEAASAMARLCDFESKTADSVQSARHALSDTRFDLMLSDIGLPDGTGFELVDAARAFPMRIALMTGSRSVELAAKAACLQLDDFLLKPLNDGRLQTLLSDVRDRWTAQQGPSAPPPGDFVGMSRAMQSVYAQIHAVAPSTASVLLVGESGTGKEIAARAIHANSGRRGAFVALNCGAVAPELLASHLFGHEKGSFTGAVQQHRGLFEQAHEGTLFLDEITEMPAGLQPYLLRVLETQRVTRVGATSEHPLSVRVVAATNRDPQRAIGEGVLRPDLYYRLSEFAIVVPPLRERDDDVLAIARALLAQMNARYSAQKRFDERSLAWLAHYSWPGNCRELRNAIHRAYILSDGERVSPMPPELGLQPRAVDTTNVSFPVATPLAIVEREMLLRTLAHFHGDKQKTAAALGISTKTVYNHLARHSIPGNDS